MRVEGPKEHPTMGCVVEDHIPCVACHNILAICVNTIDKCSPQHPSEEQTPKL